MIRAANGKFDTVLIHETSAALLVGVEGMYPFTSIIKSNPHKLISESESGYRIAQVRLIFTLPVHLNFKKPLAYIEYFTKFSEQRKGSDLYAVKWSYTMSESQSKREAAVVCLDSIRRSCHLIPNFLSQGNDDTFLQDYLC